ncbi:MAG: bacillithiol biosynthesis cysteine-adding enzyme BshC [Bacteroidia bacterium]|nr:bacillithiol biosynthesis cysteine-adding enzyme BshC [Bacteroidia bacterium]
MSHATRQIRQDYLQGADPLRPFYQHSITEPDFQAIIAARQARQPDRNILREVIRYQYRDLPPHEAVTRNIQLLGEPDTYTVTTGHQLVIFGGPLFTIYKVMSVIRLAEQLTARHPDTPVVPVFWIHTEDHDYEEINHYYDARHRKVTYPGQFNSAVGWHRLTEAIRSIAPAHLGPALLDAYTPGRSLADATRRFFHTLFGEYGLVILDADHPLLKHQFRGVMEQELTTGFSNEAVQETSARMSAAGYPLQIHPRPINLFLMDHAGRSRLERFGVNYSRVDTGEVITRETLMDLLLDHPEHFSPNVCLRPLYQEMILPNLAYIGGWGEISYWFQLRGVFEAAGVPFPLVLPRFSATVFPSHERSTWESLGLQVGDIQRTLPQLYQEYLPKVWDDTTLHTLEADILDQVARLEAYINQDISPTLARSANALHTKTRRYLENLHHKAGKVMRHRHAAPFQTLAEIKAAVQPDGLVQERTWGLSSMPFMTPDEFLRLVYTHCDPLNFTHAYLTP